MAASEDVVRVSLDGREFTCNYLGPEAPYEPAAVTSAAVVPLLPDGRIVAAALDRGIDLPGGHVVVEDASVEATVRREALEEAGIELGPLALASVIESDYFGPSRLTYMLNYVGMVVGFRPVSTEHESSGRRIVSIEEFLNEYRGDSHGMRIILQRALALAPHAGIDRKG
ncbi:MAG: NUDIX domain-containing protein [Actinobacteria bacterium]|nr:NUDIX domain-containing protein [Actinomycetota bacterium]